jgi:hypothetical protein
MDLFDTCTWADFIVETTFLGTPTIHFPSKAPTHDTMKVFNLFKSHCVCRRSKGKLKVCHCPNTMGYIFWEYMEWEELEKAQLVWCYATIISRTSKVEYAMLSLEVEMSCKCYKKS